ncbi:MAG: hypothetical protein HY645_03815 [Acidobacteria bacterium]|nr:hypothetical protein [Acidobacteriota bacterium]
MISLWMRWIHREWLLILALGLGVALRLYQIEDQIIADDEWHAVHGLLASAYGGVLSHFGGADRSIPLTFFYKVIGDTLGLNEFLMRLPSLIFGIGAMLVFPFLLRAEIGLPGSRAFAWFLAISPLHIYYSRYARPYGISMFFSFLAAVSFFKWWSGENRRWGLIYAMCSIAAPYFHLTVLPFVMAPLLVGLIATVSGKSKASPAPFQIVRLGGTVSAGLLFLLLPPFLVDRESLIQKSGQGFIMSDTIPGAIQLFFGAVQNWLAGALLFAAAVGAALLGRKHPSWLLYLIALSGIQVAFLLLAQPAAMQVPIVPVRYCISLLPVLLLMLAVALASIDSRVTRLCRVLPAGSFTLAACMLLLYAGPLRNAYYWPNSWTNHALFQYSYDPEGPYSYSSNLRPRAIPEFYFALASQPETRVVEAPWYPEWHNNPYPYYQHIYRKPMLVGFLPESCRPPGAAELPIEDPRLKFKLFLRLTDVKALADHQVGYVVFHRRLIEEIHGNPDIWKVPQSTIAAGGLEPCIRNFREWYGPPVYEDGQIVAYDVGGSTVGSRLAPGSKKDNGAVVSER